jgi:hypothetical protein
LYDYENHLVGVACMLESLCGALPSKTYIPAVVARRYAFTQPSDQRIVQQVSSLVPGHRFSSLP